MVEIMSAKDVAAGLDEAQLKSRQYFQSFTGIPPTGWISVAPTGFDSVVGGQMSVTKKHIWRKIVF